MTSHVYSYSLVLIPERHYRYRTVQDTKLLYSTVQYSTNLHTIDYFAVRIRYCTGQVPKTAWFVDPKNELDYTRRKATRGARVQSGKKGRVMNHVLSWGKSVGENLAAGVVSHV